MGRRERFSVPEKMNAIEDYLTGKRGRNQICRDMKISDQSFSSWLHKYRKGGAEGLIIAKKNKIYLESVKIQAVKEYLDGRASQSEICRRYEISSHGILHQWIKKYNSHEKLKSSGSGGRTIMTKGRITTFEERIEIVKYCIEHDRNYNETAEKYKVSYQQVRSWTVKYDEFGVDALLDRRGIRKAEGELTELERLKAQNKLLEARNKRLEMENELLKKLEEIERGRF